MEPMRNINGCETLVKKWNLKLEESQVCNTCDTIVNLGSEMDGAM
jgi:hypothetical protein